MPEMDSHEGGRSGSQEKQTAQKKNKQSKAKPDEKNLGLFEKSPSSTFMDLQAKLD